MNSLRSALRASYRRVIIDLKTMSWETKALFALQTALLTLNWVFAVLMRVLSP